VRPDITGRVLKFYCNVIARRLRANVNDGGVTKANEWPTYDRSIKTLAEYIGFHMSGPVATF
jgi:hypothetical protein